MNAKSIIWDIKISLTQWEYWHPRTLEYSLTALTLKHCAGKQCQPSPLPYSVNTKKQYQYQQCTALLVNYYWHSLKLPLVSLSQFTVTALQILDKFLRSWDRASLIVFKYNQQDAMLHNGIYYCNCSTCFRQFLRPSSGAQNSSELLMMGGGTAWNI